MKQKLFFLFLIASLNAAAQQRDSILENKVVIHSDYRLQLIAKRETEINTAILKAQARTANGFRLMILNTNDREYALKVRTELLQKFPEQKPYMWFSNPYIKLKFGNFKTKEEAEVYRTQISRMLGGISIYLLSETIEVKPDKDFNPDNIQ
ncbi:MAG: hypothetical protein ABIO82_01775 [Ginsengibacter sp.]